MFFFSTAVFIFHFILDQRFLFEGLVVCCKNTMIWFLILAVSINFVEDCNVEWTRNYLHDRYSNILQKARKMRQSGQLAGQIDIGIERYLERQML